MSSPAASQRMFGPPGRGTGRRCAAIDRDMTDLAHRSGRVGHPVSHPAPDRAGHPRRCGPWIGATGRRAGHGGRRAGSGHLRRDPNPLRCDRHRGAAHDIAGCHFPRTMGWVQGHRERSGLRERAEDRYLVRVSRAWCGVPGVVASGSSPDEPRWGADPCHRLSSAWTAAAPTSGAAPIGRSTGWSRNGSCWRPPNPPWEPTRSSYDTTSPVASSYGPMTRGRRRSRTRRGAAGCRRRADRMRRAGPRRRAAGRQVVLAVAAQGHRAVRAEWTMTTATPGWASRPWIRSG